MAAPNFQGQIQIKNLTIEGLRGGGIIDVIEEGALEKVEIYEDMFEPSLAGKLLLLDKSDIGAKLPLVGEEVILLDLEIKASGILLVPPLYVFHSKEIHGVGPDGLGKKWWELSFSTISHVAGKVDDNHLKEEFTGKIHKFVKNIIDGNEPFTWLTGQGGDYDTEIEETANDVMYRPKYSSYPKLRKDGPQDVFTLINQLAENSISKENINAANFVFYQDIYGWKFKSIESFMENEPKKTYCETVSVDNTSGGKCKELDSQIQNLTILEQGNQLQLQQRGAFASVVKYYKPRIDSEKYPNWMIGSIDTFYYKVNCRFLDKFPAAIHGFRRAGSGQDSHRWHYAFSEVYLEYDYVNHTPIFKIKPLSENPIRSSVQFTENGIVNTGQLFFEPAHNTIETGNDNVWDYSSRIGWEAPGFRIDTVLWEDGCYKLQPIRGSKPSNVNYNNTEEDIEEVFDNMEVGKKFPIVEMKIYKDVNNRPHYFFSASNMQDGECDEEDSGDDCKLQS
jgi:hypothetical protein